jgi:predicted deacylase
MLFACEQDTQWKGQDPIKKVDTHTIPIQIQWKGIYELGDGVYMSNEFVGARLNGAARTNDTLITVLISPENEKINPSPWYAFKIWSDQPQKIYVKITYPENAGHRYLPKLSLDGEHWTSIDTNAYWPTGEIDMDGRKIPKEMTMRLSISQDTLIVSAQELITSVKVEKWMTLLDTNDFVHEEKVGMSRLGSPISALKIGNGDDKKMIVLLSRQHPPEVTGYLALKAFVETLCAETQLSETYREEYTTYVLPLLNPDGVDKGHWRHNAGGVDLNRDWADFNQPEIKAVRDFLNKKVRDSGGKIYIGIDFHSTWEDIYYTQDPSFLGNMPGIIPQIIALSAAEFSDYEPNIKMGLDTAAAVTSTAYLFQQFGAESFTYEIGDNTSRDFVRKKGEMTALKMMDLLVK